MFLSVQRAVQLHSSSFFFLVVNLADKRDVAGPSAAHVSHDTQCCRWELFGCMPMSCLLWEKPYGLFAPPGSPLKSTGVWQLFVKEEVLWNAVTSFPNLSLCGAGDSHLVRSKCKEGPRLHPKQRKDWSKKRGVVYHLSPYREEQNLFSQ